MDNHVKQLPSSHWRGCLCVYFGLYKSHFQSCKSQTLFGWFQSLPRSWAFPTERQQLGGLVDNFWLTAFWRSSNYGHKAFFSDFDHVAFSLDCQLKLVSGFQFFPPTHILQNWFCSKEISVLSKLELQSSSEINTRFIQDRSKMRMSFLAPAELGLMGFQILILQTLVWN